MSFKSCPTLPAAVEPYSITTLTFLIVDFICSGFCGLFGFGFFFPARTETKVGSSYRQSGGEDPQKGVTS